MWKNSHRTVKAADNRHVHMITSCIYFPSVFYRTRRTPEKFRQLDKVLRLKIFWPDSEVLRKHRITRSRLVDQQTLRGSGSGPLFPVNRLPSVLSHGNWLVAGVVLMR
ncbi:uncharacterized protein EAF02_003786 [Botrytis sinoallii]|uniref:uncharacterized protein n=1 Tax=Botrytis sinoallii TaxID=1463999 RepID=UPI001900C519|nr:uncharacterized protein EAF02_003786 [Botrytis sinoallii]KAF7887139.1 hypothetical protein EAF02_003786 [Botrytis sinoallii]